MTAILPHQTSFVSLIAIVAVAGLTSNLRRPDSAALDTQSPPTVAPVQDTALTGLPLYFEPNQGQADPAARFVARGGGYRLSLLSHAAHMTVKDTAGASRTLTMEWTGADDDPPISPEEALGATVTYIGGRDRSGWVRDLPTFKQVRYDNVYPGIDLVFHGRSGRLEYDFVVAPHRPPSDVRLRFSGADRVAIDASGELLLYLGETALRQHKPVAYQDVDGERRLVDAVFRLAPDGEVSFALGAYDASRTLVIDPVIEWGEYINATNGFDRINDVALNSKGDVIVASTETVSGADSTAVISVVGSAGQLIARTVIDEASTASGVAVDDQDNAYIVGETSSWEFPTTANALIRDHPVLRIMGIFPLSGFGANNGYLLKLPASGGDPMYASYLGGDGEIGAVGSIFPGSNQIFKKAGIKLRWTVSPGDSRATKVVVRKGTSHAYVTGWTQSTAYPTTIDALQPEAQENVLMLPKQSAFVSIIDTAATNGGDSLLYSTYLASMCTEEPKAIAVNHSNGDFTVTGSTASNTEPILCGKFPTSPGAALARGSGFLTRIPGPGRAQLHGVIFSTYLKEPGIALGVMANGDTQVVEDRGGSLVLTKVVRQGDGSTTLASETTIGTGSTAAISTKLIRRSTAPEALLLAYGADASKVVVARIDASSGATATITEISGNAGSTAGAIAADHRSVFVGVNTRASDLGARSSNFAGNQDGFLAKAIYNPPPAIAGNALAGINEGQSKNLVVATVASPGVVPLELLDVVIHWGDGTKSDGTASVAGSTQGTISGTHTYPDSGSYAGQVCITEWNAPLAWICAPFTVAVSNVAPSITVPGTIFPNTAGAVYRAVTGGVEVALNSFATISDPGVLDTFSGTVDWGTGPVGTPIIQSNRQFASVSHVFTSGGSHTVGVCATDKDGGNDCKTFTVFIPSVNLSVSKTVAPASAAECSTFSYSLHVKNWGPNGAPNVVLTDVVSDLAGQAEHLSYIGAFIPNDSGNSFLGDNIDPGFGNRLFYGLGAKMDDSGRAAVVVSVDRLKGDRYPRVDVYHRNPNGLGWQRVQQLNVPDFTINYTLAQDQFAIDDDVIVFGTRVYLRSNGVWGADPVQTLTPSVAGDRFGATVAVRGGVIAVADADPFTPNSHSAGDAVYIFERSGATWSETARLTPSRSFSYGWGRALAISENGGWVAVGSTGNTAFGADVRRGEVVVYYNNGGAWQQLGSALNPVKVAGSNDSDFGQSVALTGKALLIGAPREMVAGTATGAAYVFKWDGGAFVQDAHLAAASSQFYGLQVALDGGLAIVGSQSPRAAFVYQDVESGWAQIAQLDVTSPSSFRAPAVSVGGGTILVADPESEAVTSYGSLVNGGNRIEINLGTMDPGDFGARSVRLFVKAGAGLTSGSPVTVAASARAASGGVDTADGDNTSTASFQVTDVGTACSDSTPPQIAPVVTGTLGQNGWYTSDVSIAWTVSEPESIASLRKDAPCGPTTITSDTAATTSACAADSNGGNAQSNLTVKRDATPPKIFVAQTPTGTNTFEVGFSCNDAGSGIASCPGTISAAGGATVSGTTFDAAGNRADITVRLPRADAGLDRVVTAAAFCAADVTLDASGSFDPSGQAQYFWAAASQPNQILATGALTTVSLPVGTHALALLTVTPDGVQAFDDLLIEVQNTTPPSIHNVPDGSTLIFRATGSTTQVEIPMPTATGVCQVSLTSNAPPNGFAEGRTPVVFTATDASGLQTLATTTVTILPQVDLALAVAAVQSPVVSGAPARLRFTVSNHGPSDASAVTVRPVLPPQVALQSIDTNIADPDRCTTNDDGTGVCETLSVLSEEATCRQGPDGLACIIGTVQKGTSASFDLTFTTHPAFRGSLDVSGASTALEITSDVPDLQPSNNAASHAFDVSFQTDLSIGLSGPSQVVAGAAISYSLTVGNAGPSSAANVVARMGLDWLTPIAPLPSNCAVQDMGLVCTVGPLDAGAQATVAPISLRIDPARRSASFGASANVSGADHDPNAANNAAEAVAALSVAVDRSIQVSAATLVAGADGALVMRAFNGGPSSATSVIARVVEPAGALFTAPLPAGCGLATRSGSREVVCSASIQPDQSSEWLLDVYVDPAHRGALSINASVSGPFAEPDGNVANDSVSFGAAVEAIANLGLTIEGTEPSAIAGRATTFRAVVTNLGPSTAGDVTLSWEGMSATTIGALTVGESTVLTTETSIDPFARGQFDVAAFVSGAESDPHSANNRAAASVSLTTAADLAITLTASDAPQAGGTLTYTMRIVNHGPSGATALRVQQLLPAGVTFDTAPGCVFAAGVGCEIDRLAPEASDARTVLVSIAPATYGDLISTATVAGAEGDPDPASNAATLTTTVVNTLDVAIEVSAHPVALVAGQGFSYAIAIENKSAVPAADLEITHRLPVGISAGVLPDGCLVAASLITCRIGALGGYATTTLTLPVVPATPGSLTAVTNLGLGAEDIDLSNNTATTVVLVGSQGRGPIGTGDFDGDGDLDVAVADEDDHLVKIYMNESSRFVLRDTARVGRKPEALAIGDLDNDGDLDIATINRQRSDVSIVINDGRGSFTERARPDLDGSSPVAITVGDFTGDGRLDIVVALRDNDGLAMLTRDSDGDWREVADQRRTRFRSRWCRLVEKPSALAAGDFDGDGDLDLVLLAQPGRSLAVMTNNGAGRFTESSEVAVHNSRLHDDIAVGDFDGDGDLDLAITGLSHDRITIMTNTGHAAFARTGTTRVGRKPEAIASGDMTGDGKLDLVTANRNDDSVSIAINVGGAFPNKAVSEHDTVRRPVAIILGDYNGDGRLDIVVVDDKHERPHLLISGR